jgi:hypothetical protein
VNLDPVKFKDHLTGATNPCILLGAVTLISRKIINISDRITGLT